MKREKKCSSRTMNSQRTTSHCWTSVFCSLFMSVATFSLSANSKKPEASPMPSTLCKFEENRGQIRDFTGILSSNVKFVHNTAHFGAFLFDWGLAYQFTKASRSIFNINRSRILFQATNDSIQYETFRVNMHFVDANEAPTITTEGKSSDFINYYNTGTLDVHRYEKITYHNLYPGIDWVVYSRDNQFKYDFIIHPGADPSAIKMRYEYQDTIYLDHQGNLCVNNSLGSIVEKAPVCYQGKREVSGNFSIDKNIVSFYIGNYDRTKELVIDPAVIWSSYYGSSNYDTAMWNTTDDSGYVYVAGITESMNSIAANGFQVTFGGTTDAFLTKFDRNGNRIWCTYYGGADGDYGIGCCTDRTGNVYLVGLTTSTANISASGHQISYGGGVRDGFLVKLNKNGLRLWATYYGGTGLDYINLCSTDAVGNLYACGAATSTSNIAFGGFSNALGGSLDAFLVKFDSTGVRLWATYYGGSGTDDGVACVTDPSGNIYMSGQSSSASNIASGGHQNTYGGAYDAFLVKFSSSGQRIWGTYYGGVANDKGFCETDLIGNVFLVGTTASTSNICSTGFQSSLAGGNDAFLAKFDANGNRIWSTYFGGAGYESVRGCSCDTLGNIFVTGNTTSSVNFSSGGWQNNFGGSTDAYIAKFDISGQRIWSSYFGSTDFDYGNCCDVDKWGSIYLVGETSSTLNISSNGFQNTYGGSTDGFVVRLCGSPPGPPPSIYGNPIVCSGTTNSYSISSFPGVSIYSWTVPSGWSGGSTSNTITLNTTASGVLQVSQNNGCGFGAPQTLAVFVSPTPTLSIEVAPEIICQGSNAVLTATGATTYTWSTGSQLNPIVINTGLTNSISVAGANSQGCLSDKSFTITVDECASIGQVGEQVDFSIYPNPSSGRLQVHSASAGAQFSIFDQMGRNVAEFHFDREDSVIVSDELPNGVYTCRLVVGTEAASTKVVVIRDP
jgi:hypothetical protein